MPNYYKKYQNPNNLNTYVQGAENMYTPYNICPYCNVSHAYLPEQLMSYINRANMYINDINYDPRFINAPMVKNSGIINIKDHGPEPYVVNINEATLQNSNYRTVLWTGSHLQVTLMSINPGEDIGLEIHPDTDQFLRIEDGHGLVKMGDTKDKLDFQENVYDEFAILIPAGKWHNVINVGHKPLKIYSIYAPPHHPHGAVHQTKSIAQIQEANLH
ncbi:MAG: cupin domain-containing protein [Clostridia bacterium]|nr:cupin domain-containing protein [Clostridia bacterium]